MAALFLGIVVRWTYVKPCTCIVHVLSVLFNWLVVWNMNLIFHFIYGMSSFPLSPSLFRGVGQPPTRYSASSSSPGHTPKPTWGPTGPRVTFGFPMGVLQLIHPSEHTNILDFNLGFPIRSDHLIYDDLRMQNLAAFRS